MKKLCLLLVCVLLVLAGCQSNSPSTPPLAPEASLPLDGGESVVSPDSDISWQYIQDKGELIIGLDDTFAPMGFRDEAGTLVGFDIDLAEAVCAKMGVKAKFQPIDWDAKEMELSTQKIDCIWNGMSITPEREESMSLTRGYLNNRIIIMTAPGVTVTTKDDLKNLSVGTQAGSSALEMAQADPIFDSLTDFHEYPDYDSVIMDMDAGRIQVMLVDEVLGMYKNSKRDTKFGVAPVDFGDDFYAVGLRKEDKALTAKLQEAIDAVIADGTAATISEKWFGSDIVVKP